MGGSGFSGGGGGPVVEVAVVGDAFAGVSGDWPVSSRVIVISKTHIRDLWEGEVAGYIGVFWG